MCCVSALSPNAAGLHRLGLTESISTASDKHGDKLAPVGARRITEGEEGGDECRNTYMLAPSL